jgi:hypothetical protein
VDDLVKANVDGAVSRDNEEASVVVILRDRQGHYLGFSVIVFSGVINPLYLEALDCEEVLSLATDFFLRRVCVASDCK